MYLANLLVDNPYTHSFVRRAVDRILAESVHLSVDYRVVRVRMFPPAVDLYGLEIRRTDLSPGQSVPEIAPQLLSAAHIRATLSIWSLLIGSPQLASFEANNARVELDEYSTLGRIFKPAAGLKVNDPDKVLSWPPAFPVPVRKIILRNAHVMIFDSGKMRKVPLAPASTLFRGDNIDFSVTAQAWDSADISIAAANVDLRIEGTNYATGARMVADATYNTNTVDLRISNIESSSSSRGLSGDGHVRLKFDEILPSLELRKLSGEASMRVAGDISLVGAILDIPETNGPAKAAVKARFTIPLAGGGHSAKKGSIKPELSVIADTESAGAVFGGFKLHNFKSKLDIDLDRIAFEDVQLFIGARNYGTGKGLLRFDGPGLYSFDIRPVGLPLGKLLDVFNVNFDAFDVEMTSDDLLLTGTSSPFKMKASASVVAGNITLPATPYDHSSFPDSPICNLDLRLDIDSARIVFDGSRGLCRAGGGTSSLGLSGPVWFDDARGIDLHIELSELDARIGEYFAQIPLRGSGAVKTRIHGPYSRVLIDGDFNFRILLVDKLMLGHATGNWSVDGKKVSWNGVRLVPGEGSEIIIDAGSLNTSGEMHIESSLSATNVPQGFINGLLETAGLKLPLVFGVESTNGKIKGPLLEPLWWDIDASATVFDLELEGKRLADHASVKLDASLDGWRISQANAILGDLGVDGKANITRDLPPGSVGHSARRPRRSGFIGADRAEIDARAYSISNLKSTDDHLSRLPFLADLMTSMEASGYLTGNLRLAGRIDALEGAFETSILRPRMLGSAIAPLRVKGVVSGQKYELIVNQGGNALEGRLSIDMSRQSMPFDWFLTANRLDLRFVATPWFASDPRNYLYASGSWVMRGEFANFWQSEGKLVISKINGRLLREVLGEQRVIDLATEDSAEFNFSGGNLRAPPGQELVIAAQQGNVRVKLGDGNQLPKRVNISVDSTIELALLRDLVPQIESATGKIQVKGSMRGSIADPDFTLEVSDVRANPFTAGTWEPLSLGLADFRPPLRNMRFKAHLQDGILFVDAFSAAKGSGRLEGSGAIPLFADEDAQDSTLDLRLEDATVVYPVAFLKSFESSISGNLSLSGRGKPYRLSGDLRVTRARSTREVDLREEILNTIRRQAVVVPQVARDPLMQFDIAIRADQTINVNNRVVQALLSSNLQLTGSDQQPSVLGQIEIARGKFVYKRDFSITRGIISFDDPLRVDPTLEISAVSEVQNYRVYINMTGRASNPRVDFSVDPPTRQNGTPINKVDILVLLGRGSLPEEQQALGESQNVAAAEGYGIIAGLLEEPVEKLFDLSGQKVVREVYIDTYASPDGKPVPRVNLPLNLGDELDVVLRVDPSSLKVSSEYSVSENISVSGGFERQNADTTTAEENQGSAPADTGVDLKFRFAFP